MIVAVPAVLGSWRCLPAGERFDFRNVAIDLKHGVITEQLHPVSRQASAASCAGRGIATMSANVVRNPSASVSGNFTRSSGTEVRRRIAPIFERTNPKLRTCQSTENKFNKMLAVFGSP